MGRVEGIGHSDALAPGKPVGLDHQAPARGVLRGRVGDRGVEVGEGARLRGRHAGSPHLALGIGLRRLEARRLARWSEDVNARLVERVGDAGGEGRLRTDDDHVVSLARGVSRNRGRVQGIEIGHRLCDRRRAPIPRRDAHPGHALVAGEPPGEGVLAPAAAQDQDLEPAHSLRGGAGLRGAAG